MNRFDAVMLVLGIGLKAKFCGLDLGLRTVALALEVLPWPKIQGQNLGRLQSSPLTSIDWSMHGDGDVLQV